LCALAWLLWFYRFGAVVRIRLDFVVRHNISRCERVRCHRPEIGYCVGTVLDAGASALFTSAADRWLTAM
jgi:hypothetical protein